VKIDVPQDLTARVAAEIHVLEADLAARHRQPRGSRRIQDPELLLEQAQRLLGVHHGVARLAEHEAERVQRQEDLDT
jgi:hypothetical protein